MQTFKQFERRANKPFAEAALRYLKEFDGKHKRTQALRLEAVVPYIGKTPLFLIDNEALKEYKEDRLKGRGAFKTPAKAGTVNSELGTVRAVMNKAFNEWRWVPGVPKIRNVKGATKVAHPLTLQEKNRIFSNLKPFYKDVFEFMLNTGVRCSELRGLKWEHMTPVPNGFVFILLDTKNGQQRPVICNSVAQRVVNRQRDNGSEYVFCGQGSVTGKGYRGRIANLHGPWRAAWKAAGMPEGEFVMKGPHNLRHTFASWLDYCGVDRDDVSKLLGHHNADITRHYSGNAFDRLIEAAERITDASKLGHIVLLRAVPNTY